MMHIQPSEMRRTAEQIGAPARMTPWRYLKLRRLAAGLTIERLAESITPRGRDRRKTVALIALLETEGAHARNDLTLRALANAFPFDPLVYRQLAEEPADRHPRVCGTCGCSHWDPCESEAGCCAWTAPDQCSRCAGNDGAQAGDHA
ncbi:hypothetical protein [Sphingomonas sp. NFR15]|uniref:hypothetical protein n=1 Tax=Sphingomonas sp. NFR15 TaxID=1566282 RepID=UPI000882FF50|nr:hypothetical protein [Sphingomonas sp. NFR15]SDA21735.1 hypothetical protein SAMN03159340_01489 [Sphingomonas sp. NFR15]